MSQRSKAEVQEAMWEPVEGEHEETVAVRPPSMVYRPRLRGRGASMEVVGTRDDPDAQPWGFWIGVGAIFGLVGFIAWKSSTGGFTTIQDLLVAMIFAAIAVIAMRFGPHERQTEAVLVSVDAEAGHLTWPTPSNTHVVVDFEEIPEVVFAMVYFPLSPSRPDARIHVFTLLVRDGEGGDLIPVVEASPDKEETFALARQLSQLVDAPITQVGEGVQVGNL